MRSPFKTGQTYLDPSDTKLPDMTSPPTYKKVHAWLLKSPDPPRQSQQRIVASPKPLPGPIPKCSSPIQPASPPNLFIMPKAFQGVSTSEDAIDIPKSGTSVNEDKNEDNHLLEIIDRDEKIQAEGDRGDAGIASNRQLSTSIWEDAVLLLFCTMYWLTAMALVCLLSGLIIVWKTGYRLGLRTRARRIRRQDLNKKE